MSILTRYKIPPSLLVMNQPSQANTAQHHLGTDTVPRGLRSLRTDAGHLYGKLFRRGGVWMCVCVVFMCQDVPVTVIS